MTLTDGDYVTILIRTIMGTQPLQGHGGLPLNPLDGSHFEEDSRI
jgi:hypothetical protein